MTAASRRLAACRARHADNRTAAPPRLAFCQLPAALLALTALLSGCSGNKPINESTPGLNVANNNWFCQMAEDGESWECVEDESLVRRPRPTRLPGATVSAAEPEADQPLTLAAPAAPGDGGRSAIAAESAPAAVAEAAAGAADGNAAADTAARAGAEATAAEDAPQRTAEADLPAHVRLAYQPPQPTLLQDLPGELYTVQLLAMSNKATLEAYVRDHGLKGLSAARIENEGDLYYVLLLGVYESEALARQAAEDLPPPLDEASPWIRPLGSLQEAMRRADELAGSQVL